MKVYEFDAVIKKHPAIDACFVEFPYDMEEEFGTKGQVKVKTKFDEYEYRGSLAKMRTLIHCIGISQEIRKKINKHAGDIVHVIIIKDTDPRTVIIPEDFLKKLEENLGAKNFFNTLSYTNQKEYVQWIFNTKKEETKLKKLNNSIVMLLNKVKHP